MGCPIYLECPAYLGGAPFSTPIAACIPPLGSPLSTLGYPWARNPFLTLGANVPRAARCAVGAVQAAPHAPVHRRMRYSLGTRRLNGVLSLLLAWWRARLGHESPHAPPSADRPKSKVVMQVGMGLSGNRCKWESKPARRVQIGLKCRPHSSAHTGPRAVAPDPYQYSGVVGNNTMLALAAGFGGAFALLLVVMILRNRRAARAVDPAPDVRTLLYVE
jgi:hypothetical protein